jgi:protein TonB
METKKNPKLDYRRKSGLFFNIGLVVSLFMAITAFEWKIEDKQVRVDFWDKGFDDEIILVLATTHATPPSPKVVPINVNEVPDDIVVEIEDIPITFDPVESASITQEIFSMPEPKEDDPDEIFPIVESMPEFEGGIAAFYKFVGENLKYPAQARRLGIEGRVYVNFVVDRDGSLSQLVIARGIGAGCDEEVLRILEMSPKWIPGKQRGNPVRVRMMLPITFRLQ